MQATSIAELIHHLTDDTSSNVAMTDNKVSMAKFVCVGCYPPERIDWC